jgi:hypothetical protein
MRDRQAVRHQVNVRLTTREHELLLQAAAATDLSRTQVMRLLFRQGVARLVVEARARRQAQDRVLGGVGGASTDGSAKLPPAARID